MKCKMLSSWSLLCVILIYFFKVNCIEELENDTSIENSRTNIDTRRPLWNVAHMVNALYQVDYYLDQGANSLEFDVSFDWQGIARYTFHGVPCDCFRSCLRYEDFVTYIEYLRKLTSPAAQEYRKELVLLFMDCKVHGLTPEAKLQAGEDLASKLLDYYWEKGRSGANAYILISVPSIMHMDFVESFRRKLKSENFTSYFAKIGYDFSGNEDLDTIRSAYESAGISQQVWQGDGITNCLPRGTSRLRDALQRRDKPELEFIDKVYWWTVDRMSTMRYVLRMGVDGMITNFPDRLVSILREDEFSSKFKLATLDDNPWETHALRAESLMNLLQEAREENLTDFKNGDEILYNCDETAYSKSLI